MSPCLKNLLCTLAMLSVIILDQGVHLSTHSFTSLSAVLLLHAGCVLEPALAREGTVDEEGVLAIKECVLGWPKSLFSFFHMMALVVLSCL